MRRRETVILMLRGPGVCICVCIRVCICLHGHERTVLRNKEIRQSHLDLPQSGPSC